MIPDERDTIVAAATARGGAARGIVRLSGPDTLAVVECLLSPPLCGGIALDTGSFSGAQTDHPAKRRAERVADLIVPVRLAGREHAAPVDLYLWRGAQSYTRQPSAELHTIGSPPIVDAVVEAACRAGARLAEPGEFTLRAFLAGRIDLTQAEAVLGVIDAPDGGALTTALDQLAGGLAKPLNALREDLLSLLAELEAGLDFVEEEDIRFVEPAELQERLATAVEAIAALVEQTTSRGRRDTLPKVALVGPPNAGKSSLFNALRLKYGVDGAQPIAALVSAEAGTTRDSLAAVLAAGGAMFELLDTAGISAPVAAGPGAIADQHARRAALEATLRLRCHPIDEEASPTACAANECLVLTKADHTPSQTAPPGAIVTSSASGAGLEELMGMIGAQLAEQSEEGAPHLVANTAERCRRSLSDAHESLLRAVEIAPTDQHDLAALELRSALEDLGQVVGAVVTDDILDRIFSQFCIGK